MSSLLIVSLVLVVVSLASLLGSGAVALIYELEALDGRKVQTISEIVQTWAEISTKNKQILSAVGIGSVAGLLALAGGGTLLLVHFLGGF